MASLDVLDYLTGLDDALLAQGVRSPGIRRAALRDARRLIEAMAFRFALMDERPLPEDLDHVRAIEAMKAPELAAPVLARRAPIYARARRRRLVTTWTILALFLVAVGGLAYLATSEKAETVASLNERSAVDVTYSRNATFTIDPTVNRLHVDGTIFVGNGSIDVRLYRVDPATGAVETAMSESYAPRDDNYLRFNVEAPASGTWTLLIDFNDARGSADVTVDAIRPTR